MRVHSVASSTRMLETQRRERERECVALQRFLTSSVFKTDKAVFGWKCLNYFPNGCSFSINLVDYRFGSQDKALQQHE